MGPLSDSISSLPDSDSDMMTQRLGDFNIQPQSKNKEYVGERDRSDSMASVTLQRQVCFLNHKLTHPLLQSLSRSRPHSELLISVSDPQTVGEGMKSHTAYKIVTKTSSSTFKNSEFFVHRRFKDFLWLNQQLSVSQPGVIVPPAPEKHAIGRFEQDFVENRRVQLERMLNKIAEHPVLQSDSLFRMFLEAESLQENVSAFCCHLDCLFFI